VKHWPISIIFGMRH